MVGGGGGEGGGRGSEEYENWDHGEILCSKIQIIEIYTAKKKRFQITKERQRKGLKLSDKITFKKKKKKNTHFNN